MHSLYIILYTFMYRNQFFGRKIAKVTQCFFRKIRQKFKINVAFEVVH